MEKRLTFPMLLVAAFLLGTVQCDQESSKTHFLLVHGGGHGAWCWYKVVTLLQELGYEATAFDLTSHGTRDKTYADNVTSVAQYVKPVADYLEVNVTDKIVLVGHSFGGFTVSYLMELFPEKISQAIFLAALMPKNGQSGASSLNPKVFATLAAEGATFLNYAHGTSAPPTSLSVVLSKAENLFYNQSPPEDVTLSLALLDAEPFAPVEQNLTLTPSRYGSVPRYYIRTDKDHVVPYPYQIEALDNNPPTEAFFIEGSDHSAFFSRTKKFTELIIYISTLR